MQQRRVPQYRRRDARRRSTVPVHLVVLAVLAALAIGVGALVARAGESAERAERAATNEALAAEPTRAAPRSHITFGAHVSATQPCETCHPSQPTDEIVCRSCHANTCGKDSKTVADCLACHQKGTTDSWVVDGQ